MSEKQVPIENGTYDLVLGKSFDPKSRINFHSIRYDFKPASVDTDQKSLVEVGDGNQVTVTVPHVQSSGISHTVYKGNKRATQKECVLIIDHETGQISLEQLSSGIQLKKTRLQNSQPTSTTTNISRSTTPVDTPTTSATKDKTKSKKAASPPRLTPAIVESSSDSSDSDDDLPAYPKPVAKEIIPVAKETKTVTKETKPVAKETKPKETKTPKEQKSATKDTKPPLKSSTPTPGPVTTKKPALSSMLSEDLRLSDSSDSDSD